MSTLPKSLIETDQPLFCNICRNKIKYKQLRYNYKSIKKNYVLFPNICCVRCKERYIVSCFECGSYHLKTETKLNPNKNGETYCQTCFKKYFRVCYSCKKITHISGLQEGVDAKIFCQTCFEKRFAYCSKCSIVFWKDDIRWDVETKKFFCSDCWIRLKLIHDYSYNPSYKFYKCEKEKQKLLFMGFELEVENKSPLGEKAKTFVDFLEKLNLKNHFYLKNDASVNGFEIVSHPFSLKYIKTFMRMEEILVFLKNKKYKAKSNCGLHVHVDKKHISAEDENKIRMFISKYSEKIFLISDRKKFVNQFCQYEFYNTLLKEIQPLSGRHWAFNTNTNKNTVEFRMFNSTLKYENFLSALEFASSLVIFIKEISMNQIIDKKNDCDDAWYLYCKEVKKNKDYQNLYSLLKEKKLCV